MKHIYFPALLLSSALAFSGAAQAGMPDNRDVVRDARGQIIHNTFGNCVRTKWLMDGDACGPVQAAARRTEIAKEDRTIYFGFNLATLTPESQQRLNSLASVLRSAQDVKEARIVGFADRIGTASYNEKLSQKRAENVKKYLVRQGYVNSRVAETRWLGESEPKTNCPDTLSRTELIDCLQKDRRVEVEIEYLSETTPPARR